MIPTPVAMQHNLAGHFPDSNSAGTPALPSLSNCFLFTLHSSSQTRQARPPSLRPCPGTRLDLPSSKHPKNTASKCTLILVSSDISISAANPNHLEYHKSVKLPFAFILDPKLNMKKHVPRPNPQKKLSSPFGAKLIS